MFTLPWAWEGMWRCEAASRRYLFPPPSKYQVFFWSFLPFFLWSCRLSRLVSPSDWVADLLHYAHGQKHRSVSLESETDCLHWEELPPALWLRCSSWQTGKKKKSFQTLPAVILTNQPSCQKNMCHNTSTLYVLYVSSLSCRVRRLPRLRFNTSTETTGYF